MTPSLRLQTDQHIRVPVVLYTEGRRCAPRFDGRKLLAGKFLPSNCPEILTGLEITAPFITTSCTNYQITFQAENLVTARGFQVHDLGFTILKRISVLEVRIVGTVYLGNRKKSNFIELDIVAVHDQWCFELSDFQPSDLNFEVFLKSIVLEKERMLESRALKGYFLRDPGLSIDIREGAWNLAQSPSERTRTMPSIWNTRLRTTTHKTQLSWR